MGNGRVKEGDKYEGTEYSYPLGHCKDNRARRQWLTFICAYLSIEWMTELSVLVDRPSTIQIGQRPKRSVQISLQYYG